MNTKIEHLGRLVGVINREKGAYITRKTRAKHFFRKHNGYGISIEILKKMRDNRIENIILIEITSKGENKYTTTRHKFFKKGIRHTYKQADKQIILPMEHWQK